MNSNLFRALSEKSFANLWVGEILTQIAGNLFNFFLILIVFKLTQSNTAVSGAVLSFTIPAILFGSIAGVYVDRWNKKNVLIITNILRAVLILALILFLDNLVLIYIMSFLVAVLTQFFIPAETPIIPLTVHPKNLLSANALFGFGLFGSILIAYVLSGPLLLAFGPIKTLLVLALMLLLGAFVISLVHLPYATKRTTQIMQHSLNFIGDIRHTLRLIFQSKIISHSLFLLALSQILILILATIAPGYADQILGINVEEFPLVFVAPAAIGMVVGALVLVNFFHNHPRDRVITVGILLSGLAMLFLPFGSKVASRDFILTLNTYLPHMFDITILQIIALVAFVLGVANSLVFVPANTTLQEKTPDEIRGKIYGLLNTIVGALSLLPIILVGGLSDIVGVGTVITGIGVILFVLAFLRIVVK